MRRACSAVAMALLMGANTTSAAPDKPFHEVPSGPRAVPGDILPPFAMRDESGHLPPPSPLPPGAKLPQPFGPPESTAPGPDLAQATRMAAGAVHACAAQGYRVGAAVIDSDGHARALLTADGSDGTHVFVAMRKALVSLAFGMPSSAAHDLLAHDVAQMSKVTPAMFVEGGAVPIRRGGRVIGAIGVSGAAGKVIGAADEACALAGLRAIAPRKGR